MTFEYISTFGDYKAAQDLYLRHRKAARFRFLFWMIGLPVGTVILWCLAVYDARHYSSQSFELASWLAFCCTALMIWVVLLRPWTLRRCFKKMKRLGGISNENPVRFTFDDAGVTSTVVGRSEARFFWSAIQGFAEDASIALIFISEKRFLFIPKRAMDDVGWDQFHAIIRANLRGARC
jgi:uncharacterized membrane protein YhdT